MKPGTIAHDSSKTHTHTHIVQSTPDDSIRITEELTSGHDSCSTLTHSQTHSMQPAAKRTSTPLLQLNRRTQRPTFQDPHPAVNRIGIIGRNSLSECLKESRPIVRPIKFCNFGYHKSLKNNNKKGKRKGREHNRHMHETQRKNECMAVRRLWHFDNVPATRDSITFTMHEAHSVQLDEMWPITTSHGPLRHVRPTYHG